MSTRGTEPPSTVPPDEDDVDRPVSPATRADGEKRVPLTRERLLRGAIAVADTAGIGALTMRSLANELGVKPMSLYHHVANKEEILDGIIDVVFREIDLPPADADWRSAMRDRGISAAPCSGAIPGRRRSWSRGRTRATPRCGITTR